MVLNQLISHRAKCNKRSQYTLGIMQDLAYKASSLDVLNPWKLERWPFRSLYVYLFCIQTSNLNIIVGGGNIVEGCVSLSSWTQPQNKVSYLHNQVPKFV